MLKIVANTTFFMYSTFLRVYITQGTRQKLGFTETNHKIYIMLS